MVRGKGAVCNVVRGEGVLCNMVSGEVNILFVQVACPLVQGVIRGEVLQSKRRHIS